MWEYRCDDCEVWFTSEEKMHDPSVPGDAAKCEKCGSESALAVDYMP
jgi:predicted SprT family Zn-dependent metalloprotease